MKGVVVMKNLYIMLNKLKKIYSFENNYLIKMQKL